MQRPNPYSSYSANTQLPNYQTQQSQPYADPSSPQLHFPEPSDYAPAAYYAPHAYYAPVDDVTITVAGNVVAAQDMSVLNNRQFGWQAAGLAPPSPRQDAGAGNTTRLALGSLHEADEESLNRPKTPQAMTIDDKDVFVPKRRNVTKIVCFSLLGLGVVSAVVGGVVPTLRKKGKNSAGASASTTSAAIGTTTLPRSPGASTTTPVTVSTTPTTARFTTTPTTPPTTTRPNTTSTTTRPTTTRPTSTSTRPPSTSTTTRPPTSPADAESGPSTTSETTTTTSDDDFVSTPTAPTSQDTGDDINGTPTGVNRRS